VRFAEVHSDKDADDVASRLFELGLVGSRIVPYPTHLYVFTSYSGAMTRCSHCETAAGCVRRRVPAECLLESPGSGRSLKMGQISTTSVAVKLTRGFGGSSSGSA
jgi:hypothetical protein